MSSDRVVDILLATRNGSRYLPQLLESVAAQTDDRWHLVARDDASEDETPALLEGFRTGRPAEVDLGREHIGAAANFGRLAQRSTAPFAMFCDQDDVWMPDKIERLMERMNTLESRLGSETPILVHSDLRVVDADLSPVHRSYWRFQNMAPARDDLIQLLAQNTVTGCASLMNRALIERGLPIPDHAVMHDHWYALVAATCGMIDYLDDATVHYRQHAGNTTGAQRWGPGRIWRQIRLGRSEHRRKMADSAAQARAFAGRYADVIPDRQRQAVDALVRLPTQSPWQRRRSIIRHRLWKKGFVRNCAMLLWA
ncbi:MAG: glycosyltransferase family 2 protein [Acidobacteria bacterium]|nr:MAG: glycosyltransferase family 2 protein [Acidobacteriota bacterium]